MTRRSSGKARFAFPPDLARIGRRSGARWTSPAPNCGSASAIRAGSGPIRASPSDGQPLRLQPGGGSGGGRGFFAWIDATALAAKPIAVDFAFDFRGNESLSLAPQAGDTRWTVRSSWPSPSFGGDFLPGARDVGDKGFDATYRVGNLALGRSLVSTGDPGASSTSSASTADTSCTRQRPQPAASACRPRRSA